MSLPPVSLLPSGASRWEVLNEVAILLKKDVRTIEAWCEKGLFHWTDLAGGYGGTWVAVTNEGWPINGPGVKAYQEQRSESARLRSVAVRKARSSAKKKSYSKPSPRRSA